MNKLLLICFIFCLASLSAVQAETLELGSDQIIDQDVSQTMKQPQIINDVALVDPTRPTTFREDTFGTQLETDQKVPVTDDDYTGALRLHAIRISNTSRLAVINGEALRTGEIVGRAKLIKINTGSVDMDVNGEVFTISLLPDSIKKRSSKR